MKKKGNQNETAYKNQHWGEGSPHEIHADESGQTSARFPDKGEDLFCKEKMSKLKTGLLIACLVLTIAVASVTIGLFVKVMNYEKLQEKGFPGFNKHTMSFNQTIEIYDMMKHMEKLNKQENNKVLGMITETFEELKKQNELIKTLLQAKSCLESEENGVQYLRSGEEVYCHQRWRVIQRRFNGQVDFHNRTWIEYKNGFGLLSTEFWIGLDKIHRLTGSRGCRLRVELGAFDGSEAYADYRKFSIGSESDLFRLHISGYSGTAGDSIVQTEVYNNNNNMSFSTIDRDNDKYSVGNCAVAGGWWWNNCGRAKLNGRWGEGLDTGKSFTWYYWKRAWITLKSSIMMIRCD